MCSPYPYMALSVSPRVTIYSRNRWFVHLGQKTPILLYTPWLRELFAGTKWSNLIGYLLPTQLCFKLILNIQFLQLINATDVSGTAGAVSALAKHFLILLLQSGILLFHHTVAPDSTLLETHSLNQVLRLFSINSLVK